MGVDSERRWPARRRGAAGAWMVAPLIALAACSPEPASPAAEGVAVPDAPPPLLLVGWDGADPDIVARLRGEGLLPNLDRLAATGALGVLRSEAPMISPILWTTMATGVSPLSHGVLGFFEGESDGAPRFVTSAARRSKAFWDVAGEAGVAVGVIGWYATWPAEPVHGFLVSDRVGLHQLHGLAADDTAVVEAEGLLFPPEDRDLLDAARREVPRPGSREVARLFFDLTDAQRAGEAPVEVETDLLDRLADAVWSARLTTRLAVDLARRHRPRVLAVYYEGIDAVSHLFMPAAPPPRPDVSPEQQRLLGRVVDRFYRFQDGLLESLLAAVEEEANLMLLSDHGFRHGEDRPRLSSRAGEGNAPAWHRLDGTLLLAGPSIEPGAEPRDADLYDVMPTLCALAGLPRAASLEGRVLDEVLRPGADRSPPGGPDDYGPRASAPVEGAGPGEEELTERLRGLGYVVSGSGRSAGAGIPPDPMGAYNLGVIRLKRGDADGAEEAFRAARRLAPDSGLGDYGLGLAARARGDAATAVRFLEAAEPKRPNAAVAFELARSLAALGRIPGALRAAERAVQRDPGHRLARLQAARLGLQVGEWGRARRHLDAAPPGRMSEAMDRAEWHYLDGLTRRAAGEGREACLAFDRAFEAWPEHEGARRERCGPEPASGGR